MIRKFKVSLGVITALLLLLPIGYLIIRHFCGAYIPHWFCIHPEGWMAYFLYGATLGTLIVIWLQLSKLQTQIRFQALVELSREWCYEEEMLRCRNNACNLLKDKTPYFSALKKDPAEHNTAEKKLITEGLSKEQLSDVETVLEFFEKTSSFVKDKTLEVDAVWEVLGWYLVRYHYYFQHVITKVLRTYWTPNNNDITLYSNTENVYNELIKKEIIERSPCCFIKMLKELLCYTNIMNLGSVIEKYQTKKINQETIEKEFDDTSEKFIEYEKQRAIRK